MSRLSHIASLAKFKMMIEMYPVFFLMTTIALIFWQYYSERSITKLIVPLFYISIAGYVASFLLQPTAMDIKGPKLILELIFLGVVSLLTNSFKERPIALLISLSLTVLFTIVFVKWDNKRENPLVPLASDGELLIELHEGLDASSILGVSSVTIFRAFYPEDDIETTLDNYYIVDAPDNMYDIEALAAQLLNLPEVKYVEFNEVINIPDELVTTSKHTSKNLGVNDPEVGQQWGLEKLDLESFHASLKNIEPQKRALIAILDTGVDADHEDIKGNYKSLKKKHDKDGNKHGTHCAGIAAAVTNNKKGIASLAPSGKFVEITSVKVLAGFGGGTQKGIIAGMIEAADAGADVISMSLGGRTNETSRKAYTDAVNYCNMKGAIVIVAAGNSNINASQFAPANTPGVITVAAVDRDLNKASFSNTTEDIGMAVSAPGVEIHSTLPDNAYGALSGTSMSTPYVAGLVGIMKSINPDLTTKEAFEILNDSGQATKDVKQIGRLIQPKKAVELINR